MSLSALAWNDPQAPRPTSSDPAEASAWSTLGTMRSLDWDTFATAVAAAGMAVVKAEIAQPAARPHVLVLQGDVAPTWYWVEVRVEAASLAFERETGEAITLDALEALGEAYWEAWRKEQAT